MRRDGLYSSHIIEWRKAAATGAWTGLGPAVRDRRDREIDQLRSRAEEAEAELARTKAALDLVGKAHALLETLSESAEQPKVSAVINPLVGQLAEHTSVATACALLGRARGSHYRDKSSQPTRPARAPRPTPLNALTGAERQQVLAVLPASGSPTSRWLRPGRRSWTRHLPVLDVHDAPDPARARMRR